MHDTKQLREQADALDRSHTRDDMGLSMLLNQTADLLRWAADRIDSLNAGSGAEGEDDD